MRSGLFLLTWPLILLQKVPPSLLLLAGLLLGLMLLLPARRPLGFCWFYRQGSLCHDEAFSFNYTHNHDVVTRLITSKNALKSRLRDSGATNVSDDERLLAAPPSDFGFPSGAEWAGFLDNVGGSGAPNDDDDDDL